jgi:hypothetical protein
LIKYSKESIGGYLMSFTLFSVIIEAINAQQSSRTCFAFVNNGGSLNWMKINDGNFDTVTNMFIALTQAKASRSFVDLFIDDSGTISGVTVH